MPSLRPLFGKKKTQTPSYPPYDETVGSNKLKNPVRAGLQSISHSRNNEWQPVSSNSDLNEMRPDIYMNMEAPPDKAANLDDTDKSLEETLSQGQPSQAYELTRFYQEERPGGPSVGRRF